MNRRSLKNENEKLLKIIDLQTHVVQEGLDLSKIIEIVVGKSRDLFEVEGAVIELINGDELIYSAVSGLTEKDIGMRLKIANSLSGKCIAAGEALLSNDALNDSRVNVEACKKIGLASMIVMPLIFKGKPVGVLKILSKQKDAFDKEDLRFLHMISDLIAAAIQNAIENSESELFYKATHDYLTGISNRAIFYDRLRQKIALSDSQCHQFGIVIFDMDGLKTINDNFGHRAGDAAICEVANRIQSVIGREGTISRIGGDEFGVILDGYKEEKSIQNIIENIEWTVSRPFVFEGNNLELGVSGGNAIYGIDANEINQLIEVADRTMYQIKKNKKGQVR